MSGRRSRGRRRVGDCESPVKEASHDLGRAHSTPLGCEAKRTSRALPPGEQPEGPGFVGFNPEHVAPVTGYGAKAPVGSFGRCVDGNSGSPDREGTTDPGRVMTRIRLSQGRHWTTHGARHAPRSLIRGHELQHPAGPRARAKESLRPRGRAHNARSTARLKSRDMPHLPAGDRTALAIQMQLGAFAQMPLPAVHVFAEKVDHLAI